jgi:hypothetical protein
MADHDLPRPAADAVSLHTLAEQDDYAAQDQEDADYALALSLEDEEERHVRSFAGTNTQTREPGTRTAEGQEEEQGRQRTHPYHNIPDNEDVDEDYIDDTPYRNDTLSAASVGFDTLQRKHLRETHCFASIHLGLLSLR